MIIDPPTAFDPLPAWQSFLAELKKITKQDDDVKRHIALAEMEIRIRQNPTG